MTRIIFSLKFTEEFFRFINFRFRVGDINIKIVVGIKKIGYMNTRFFWRIFNGINNKIR